MRLPRWLLYLVGDSGPHPPAVPTPPAPATRPEPPRTAEQQLQCTMRQAMSLPGNTPIEIYGGGARLTTEDVYGTDTAGLHKLFKFREGFSSNLMTPQELSRYISEVPQETFLFDRRNLGFIEPGAMTPVFETVYKDTLRSIPDEDRQRLYAAGGMAEVRAMALRLATHKIKQEQSFLERLFRCVGFHSREVVT